MQQERYSYFRPLNPLKRTTSSLQYACTGLRPSCELCSSFLPANQFKELKIGEWSLDEEEMGRLAAATGQHNWLLPANMDLFTTDVSRSIVSNLFGILKKCKDQQFFVVSRNPTKLQEHWFSSPHIHWGYAASTQEELDFYAQTRFTYEETHKVKEVLFLDPLIERVTLPPSLLDHFETIFIDGYRGDREIELQTEWVEAIADQLSEVSSSTQLVTEGLGDRPMHKGVPYKTRRKKTFDVKLDELI